MLNKNPHTRRKMTFAYQSMLCGADKHHFVENTPKVIKTHMLDYSSWGSPNSTLVFTTTKDGEGDQLDIEEQIWAQLGLKINLVHPTLIEDLLGVDNQKDGANAFNVQPSEMTPGRNE